MSNRPILASSIRIIPRESSFLNRKLGSRGEIWFDRENNTLRLYDGDTNGGTSLAKSDLTNVTNSTFLAKAAAAGVGGAGVNSFSSISVEGQSNVVADSSNDTLTLIAGSNIIITTNAANDSITISSTASSSGGSISSGFVNWKIAADDSTQRIVESGETIKFVGSNGINTSSDSEGQITISGSGINSFGTIAVSGQANVVADSNNDTLTFVSGSGISITTNSTNDSLTIINTISDFSTLLDVSATSLTVDKIYLPAITMLVVTNNGASSYRFDQYGSSDNPTIYAINGTTIAFNLNVTGHPFIIQTGAGTNYNTGLVHVSNLGVVTTGSSAQGQTSGTLYWKIPDTISGGYRYQCGAHAAMVGSIQIKNFASI